MSEEKFRSIQLQFRERDVREERSSKDSKLAVDAALQAAEKAVAKSEQSTMKQIEATDARVDDVRVRLTTVEAKAEGQGRIYSAIAIIAAILISAVGLWLRKG